MEMADNLNCSNCQLTFSDVDQLVEHSSQPCIASAVDGAACSSDDVCAQSTADVYDKAGSTANADDDADNELDAELGADDFIQPQSPALLSMRQSPDFDNEDDDDDEGREHYIAKAIPSTRQANVEFEQRVDDASTPTVGSQQRAADAFPMGEGHFVDDAKPTPTSTSSLAAAANVSQLIDNNISPASKIAMLESVVYSLHQQQMFQLELIEALRRQLAAALHASSSSMPSSSLTRSGADDSSGATLDLTVPRSSAETRTVDHGSSLSSLMRLSAGVDARRAPIPGFSSLSTSPTTLSGSASDGLNAASSWPEELSALNTSRLSSASLASSVLSTPKYAPPSLSELSLFKKSKPPNVTVMRPTDNVTVENATDESSTVFKHRCRLCLKVLGSDSALQIHMRSHTGERPYKCNICGNRFTTKGNLKVHFQRHLEQYPNARMNPDPVPEYLDQQDAGGPGYDRHIVPPPSAHAVSTPGIASMQSFRHSSTPSKSAVEQLVWSTASAADGLAQDDGVGGLSNAVTSLPVKSETPQGHQPRRLPDSGHGMTSTSSLSCSTDANTQFQSPLSALSSMSSALSAFAPQLRMTFPPPPPPPISTTPLPVPPAAAIFSPFSMDSTPPLPPATVASKEMDDEDLEQYMEIQQTDTARIEDLVREATTGVTGSGSDRGGEASLPTDPNECVICHRVLSCRSALLMHYRTHTGERPYRCRLCGRTFTTKGNLKTHMAVHRGRISGLPASAQHRCCICRRDFPNSVALQQHLRTAHPSEMTMANSNGPFPFPATGNAGNAAATAAAMMMMPAVNPLLPFFNFPSFYQAPRNLFSSAAGVVGAGPLRPATADRDDDDAVELDLRKPANMDQDGRPRKRAKGDDKYCGSTSDPDGCWQEDGEMSRKVNGRCDSFSKSSSHEYSGFSPVTNDDDSNCNGSVGAETGAATDGERHLAVNKDLSLTSTCRRDEVMTDSSQSHPVCRDDEAYSSTTTAVSGENSDELSDRIAAKFTSPLVALEERVNSLDYSTSMFSRFSVAAANSGVARTDEQELASTATTSLHGDDCDMESDTGDQDRCSAIQDLRTQDYGVSHDEGHQDLYSRHTQQLFAVSPSAHKLVRSSQSDVDGRSDDSSSSRRSTSPNAGRPGSSVSVASSSQSGSSVPPQTSLMDRYDSAGPVQSPSKMAMSTSGRFTCPVCAKPFASASALEIHSRTHSGDRPFVCHVCSKAFTTKGNLKVHMSTHAWNKCPSRRGRRMTVVDPAAAVAVAAASGTFPVSMPTAKDATAAAAAFLSNTFGGPLPPPPQMFAGFVPPPPGVAANGPFFSDKTLLNYCMQAAAAGRDGLGSDALRQSMSATYVGGGDWKGATGPWIVGSGPAIDERNNNGGRTNDSALLTQRVGGELDLSARAVGSSPGNHQSSPGMRSWTSDRSSSLPLISNCT